MNKSSIIEIKNIGFIFYGSLSIVPIIDKIKMFDIIIDKHESNVKINLLVVFQINLKVYS
jgi:hypothetical protein